MLGLSPVATVVSGCAALGAFLVIELTALTTRSQTLRAVLGVLPRRRVLRNAAPALSAAVVLVVLSLALTALGW